MGQAKRRGTLEERAANPQGNPHHREWTEEERQRFVESMKGGIAKIVDGAKRSLFSTTPTKAKKQYPKPTGGKPCKTRKKETKRR